MKTRGWFLERNCNSRLFSCSPDKRRFIDVRAYRDVREYMMMKLESEMTEPVRRWMQSKGLMVREECATHGGICDLVGVLFNRQKVRRRLALKQRATIGSEFDVSLLAALPDSENSMGNTPREIMHKLGGFVSLEQVQATLDSLNRRRFVREQRGRYAKINGWMPLHRRIVAVELKLERIEEVVQQAINHTGFATESYIGLPLPIAKRLVRSDRIQRVVDSGVGVLGVEHENVTVLRRPGGGGDRAVPWMQMHMVERFWRMHQRQLSINGSTIDSGARVVPSPVNSEVTSSGKSSFSFLP